jgi:hypothetical protein
MDQTEVVGIFERAFEGVEPDENGQSVVTIRAPRTHHTPDHDAYQRSSDITGTFSVRRSMAKGNGLFAAPAFLCFKDKYAQARFVVSRPELYEPEFVRECESRLRECSSAPDPSVCKAASSSLQVEPPQSQKAQSEPSSPDRQETTAGGPNSELDAAPALPSGDGSRTLGGGDPPA